MRQPQSGSSSTQPNGGPRGPSRGRGQDKRKSPPEPDDEANTEAGSKAKTKAKAKSRSSTRPRRKQRRSSMPTSAGVALMAMMLAGGYGAYWMVVANMVQGGIESWVAAQQAEGLEVSFRSARVGGFPGVVTATLRAVSAQAGVAQGGWTWSTRSMAVEVNPLTPFALTVDMGLAPHAIRIPVGTNDVALTASADIARLRVETTRAGVRTADLTLEGARLGADALAGDGYSLDALTARYDADGPAEPTAEDTTHRLSATLTGLTMPAAARLPLGPAIPSAQVEARVLGPLRLDRPADSALSAWRDGDGVLLVDTLVMDWPPLSLQANGRVFLDDALQPDATLRARMTGFVSAVNALQAERLIRGADATMAKVLLAGLSRPGPDGDPVLELPLVVRDDLLRVGPIALLPMPRLPWGPPRGSLGDIGIRPGFSVDREGNVVPE